MTWDIYNADTSKSHLAMTEPFDPLNPPWATEASKNPPLSTYISPHCTRALAVAVGMVGLLWLTAMLYSTFIYRQFKLPLLHDLQKRFFVGIMRFVG
jgi:hypothetical protein